MKRGCLVKLIRFNGRDGHRSGETGERFYYAISAEDQDRSVFVYENDIGLYYDDDIETGFVLVLFGDKRVLLQEQDIEELK